MESIRYYLGSTKQKVRKGLSIYMFNHFGKVQRNKETIESYHNKYHGERCFIVCTSPSLKVEDLETIQKNGEITFSCNRVDKTFPKTSWRPTFYAVADEGYEFNLLSSMNAVPSEMQFYIDESYITTCRCKYPHVWLRGDRLFHETNMFSHDISDHINAFATVTYMLLQLAVYMGFKEIYIIGCDNSYAKVRKQDGTIVETGTKSYFEGGNNTKYAGQAVNTWLMDIAYEIAKKEADKGDFTIYNATRGGYLEVFKRVDFDKLF